MDIHFEHVTIPLIQAHRNIFAFDRARRVISLGDIDPGSAAMRCPGTEAYWGLQMNVIMGTNPAEEIKTLRAMIREARGLPPVAGM